jgi:hypothetical protein
LMTIASMQWDTKRQMTGNVGACKCQRAKWLRAGSQHNFKDGLLPSPCLGPY